MYLYIYIYNHENNVPPGYHHNGFMATHAFGHMMYGYIYIYSGSMGRAKYNLINRFSKNNIGRVPYSEFHVLNIHQVYISFLLK